MKFRKEVVAVHRTYWETLITALTLSRRTAELLNSIKTEESYSEPLFALQPVDGEDDEKDAHRDEDGDTHAPQSRGQSAGRLEWMKCGIDTKSRRSQIASYGFCLLLQIMRGELSRIDNLQVKF